MKYINTYPDENAYNSVSSTLPKPNVGYIIADNEVKYAPIDYSKEYLTFEALQSGTFTLTVPAAVDSTYMTSISYSLDNGETWADTTIDNTAQTITTPTINAGGKVLWKGVGKQMAQNVRNYSSFSATGNYIVNGNVMSLLYGDKFANQVTFQFDTMYNFYHLFKNNDKLISAENLTLPATILKGSCYQLMFNGCTGLTTAPVLPATILANYCYGNMFQNCTSLTTAPVLPATTLAQGCYSGMFQGCSRLNYIKAMFTTEPTTTYTNNWVSGVASTGTFVKNSAATWNVTGVNGVPSGWTVVDA